MDNTTLYPRTMVFGDEIDRCPECSHLWTEDAECHYNDCRYFSLDQETDSEEDEVEYEVHLVEMATEVAQATRRAAVTSKKRSRGIAKPLAHNERRPKVSRKVSQPIRSR